MAQDVEIEGILYAIGMESNTGYRHMEMLCDLLAVPFPPKNKPKEKNVNCDAYIGQQRKREINQPTQPRPSKDTVNPVHQKAVTVSCFWLENPDYLAVRR